MLQIGPGTRRSRKAWRGSGDPPGDREVGGVLVGGWWEERLRGAGASSQRASHLSGPEAAEGRGPPSVPRGVSRCDGWRWTSDLERRVRLPPLPGAWRRSAGGELWGECVWRRRLLPR